MEKIETDPVLPPVPHTPEIMPKPDRPVIKPVPPEIMPEHDPFPPKQPIELPPKE